MTETQIANNRSQWAYRNLLAKNPVLENDKKFLKNLFDFSRCFDPQAAAAKAAADKSPSLQDTLSSVSSSTDSTSSGSSRTSQNETDKETTEDGCLHCCGVGLHDEDDCSTLAASREGGDGANDKESVARTIVSVDTKIGKSIDLHHTSLLHETCNEDTKLFLDGENKEPKRAGSQFRGFRCSDFTCNAANGQDPRALEDIIEEESRDLIDESASKNFTHVESVDEGCQFDALNAYGNLFSGAESHDLEDDKLTGKVDEPVTDNKKNDAIDETPVNPGSFENSFKTSKEKETQEEQLKNEEKSNENADLTPFNHFIKFFSAFGDESEKKPDQTDTQPERAINWKDANMATLEQKSEGPQTTTTQTTTSSDHAEQSVQEMLSAQSLVNLLRDLTPCNGSVEDVQPLKEAKSRQLTPGAKAKEDGLCSIIEVYSQLDPNALKADDGGLETPGWKNQSMLRGFFQRMRSTARKSPCRNECVVIAEETLAYVNEGSSFGGACDLREMRISQDEFSVTTYGTTEAATTFDATKDSVRRSLRTKDVVQMRLTGAKRCCALCKEKFSLSERRIKAYIPQDVIQAPVYYHLECYDAKGRIEEQRQQVVKQLMTNQTSQPRSILQQFNNDVASKESGKERSSSFHDLWKRMSRATRTALKQTRTRVSLLNCTRQNTQAENNHRMEATLAKYKDS